MTDIVRGNHLAKRLNEFLQLFEAQRCLLQGMVLGEDLKGVASFHGGLATQTPAQPGKVKAHIISFTGTDDPTRHGPS